MMSAQSAAALLVMERHVLKEHLKILRDPDVRRSVEVRLAECGMMLMAEFHAKDYSIRPLDEVRRQLEDLPIGDRLNAAEQTALVLAWCRLVWPTLEEIAGEHDFSEATFAHEFQDIFPNSTQARGLLTRLYNLDYLAKHPQRGTYEAGPAMWSTVDHARMRRFVQERAQLVAARDRAVRMVDRRQDAPRQLEEMVLALLCGAKQPLLLREIYGELQRDQKQVKDALERLRARNQVRIVNPEKKKFSRWEVTP
jgi:hypothetical protein